MNMNMNINNNVQPLRAGKGIRILYSLSIIVVLPAMLVGGSGWIGLAIGGGPVGLGAFLHSFSMRPFGLIYAVYALGMILIQVLLLFRAYRVLRYPAALDARPPRTLGKFLRGWAILWMALSVASGIGLFAIKPITLAVFKSAGDSGIGYFVVGVYLTLAASSGWIGCMLFEASRKFGHRVPEDARTDPNYKRKQDWMVLLLLAALVVGGPDSAQRYFAHKVSAQSAAKGSDAAKTPRPEGKPCGEGNLSVCVSTTEEKIARAIGLTPNDAVALDTKIKAIYFARAGEEKRSLVENPSVSLRELGHTVSPDAKVRVALAAAESPEGVVLTMVIRDGSEETARFVTRYGKGSRIVNKGDGIEVSVEIPRFASPGARSAFYSDDKTGYFFLDQVFIHMRKAMASVIDPAEWAARVTKQAVMAAPDANDRSLPFTEKEKNLKRSGIDESCKGIVGIEASPGKHKRADGVNLGWPYWELTFTGTRAPGPRTLAGSDNLILCRDDGVWIIAYALTGQHLAIRQFTKEGQIKLNVETQIPPAQRKTGEFVWIDGQNISVKEGKLRFSRLYGPIDYNPTERESFTTTNRRENFEIAL